MATTIRRRLFRKLGRLHRRIQRWLWPLTLILQLREPARLGEAR